MRTPADPASLSISMIGTRGVPAAYGGFETAVEEIGARLTDRGHRVVVYCRGAEDRAKRYRGMRLVHLPALRRRSLETLSHTGLSVAHAVTHRRPDAAFVFNAANAPFVPLLRARGVPTAVHVDGLEWRRDKWSGAGREYYRRAEAASVRFADALIADAAGIADYYRDEFGAPTEEIAYGAPLVDGVDAEALAPLGLHPGGFHVLVARFEPENHVELLVRGYRSSRATLPLVVVGSAPYAHEYTRAVEAAAAGDQRIRLVGGVWDQRVLTALYSGATTYLHGHSVGGTNPSLLRAMGAGTAVIGYDVPFNRDVAGPDAWFVADQHEVAAALEAAERDLPATAARGEALRRRAAERYDWDDVAERYERLAAALARGETIHGRGLGARRRDAASRREVHA